MGAFDGLDLCARADLLGISGCEYLQLARADKRIVASEALATDHAIAKTHAWLAAGRPHADLERLVYRGGDDVHRALTATLATLPLPAQWHAVTSVLWVSIGGDRVAGWMSVVPVGAMHVIAIDASMPAELIPAIAVHELSHAIHAKTEAAPPSPRVTASEHTAITLAVETMRGGDIESAIRKLYAGERLANATAACWGYPSDVVCPDSLRIDWLRADLFAARERASEIVDALSPMAACERTRP